MIRLKSKEEIEILKEGGRRHAEILKKVASLVSPGISTQTLEDEARRLIEEGGDEASFLGYTPEGAKRPFPAALCVSINEEIVHGIPNEGERIIKEGDIVSLDLGLVHKGLFTDSAITVPAGKISKEARELINATRTALEKGLSAISLNGRIGDIGAAISAYVETTPFKLAKDLVGHGVGYAVHEDPYVPNTGIKGTGEELVPGMVIAIEPMLNVGSANIKTAKDGYTILTKDGSLSAHFEHTVAITEDGPIILTL